METSLDIGNDTTGDDILTRHSSKLSLGSSPSILSADDEDGDDDEGFICDPSGNSSNNNDHHHTAALSLGMHNQKDGVSSEEEEEEDNHSGNQATSMTQKNKVMIEKNGGMNDNGDDDVDDLFDGSLPSCTSDLDDMNMEHDSASPLSSVPDDFPLSPETTPDDSPLLSSSSSPPHNSTSLATPPLPPPPPPTSPMTRRQKQKQLQAETTSSSLPRESGSGEKRTSMQGDITTTPAISSSGSTNKRRRRSKTQGDQTQLSDRTPSGNSVKGDLYRKDINDSHQAMKSRRSVSIHGRNFHNKSTTDTNAEEEDDNNDDNNNEEREDQNKVDETANGSSKQTPLGSTKHHNSTKEPIPPPKTNTSTQQQQQPSVRNGGGGDNGHQNTDSNNEEKENTPMISKHDNGCCAASSFRNGHSDEEEYRDDQHQHKEAYDALTRIEVEFARLRDKLYQEKMAELNEEAMMIANGTHPSLVTLMAEIEEKKGRRINTAEVWRKYQHANFKRQFEGFEYQTNVHFISRKLSMRRKILAETNGKRWRLKDDVGKLHDSFQKHDKLIPDTNALMIRKQGQRDETMDLQDIKEVIGFPRAPQVTGLSTQDIRDDLVLLGLGASGSH